MTERVFAINDRIAHRIETKERGTVVATFPSEKPPLYQVSWPGNSGNFYYFGRDLISEKEAQAIDAAAKKIETPPSAGIIQKLENLLTKKKTSAKKRTRRVAKKETV